MVKAKAWTVVETASNAIEVKDDEGFTVAEIMTDGQDVRDPVEEIEDRHFEFANRLARLPLLEEVAEIVARAYPGGIGPALTRKALAALGRR